MGRTKVKRKHSAQCSPWVGEKLPSKGTWLFWGITEANWERHLSATNSLCYSQASPASSRGLPAALSRPPVPTLWGALGGRREALADTQIVRLAAAIFSPLCYQSVTIGSPAQLGEFFFPGANDTNDSHFQLPVHLAVGSRRSTSLPKKS